jgi:putative flippase GtrA
MNSAWTFVRFVINGLFAIAVHYAALVTLVDVAKLKWVGLANGIASVFGITASYLGNRTFVFRSQSPATRTLPRFLVLYGAMALLHTATLTLWTDMMRFPYTPGFLITAALTTLATFFGNRYFVFRRSRRFSRG